MLKEPKRIIAEEPTAQEYSAVFVINKYQICYRCKISTVNLFIR